MRPPTKEEEAKSEELVDDGWGRHLDGENPYFIQSILDDQKRSLITLERRVHHNLTIWEVWDENRVMHIQDLERSIIIMNPWIWATGYPADYEENLSRAQQELEEARQQYAADKVLSEEIRKSDKANVATKKKEIAVVEHALLLALYGLHASAFPHHNFPTP